MVKLTADARPIQLTSKAPSERASWYCPSVAMGIITMVAVINMKGAETNVQYTMVGAICNAMDERYNRNSFVIFIVI